MDGLGYVGHKMIEAIIIIYFASTVFALVFYALREDGERWALVPVWNTIVTAWFLYIIVECVIKIIWINLTEKEQ